MRLRRLLGGLYTAVLYAQVALGFAVVWLGGVQRADVASLRAKTSAWPQIAASVLWLQSEAWWFLPALILASGALGLYRKFVGPPWLWEAVHYYLDTFREDVFCIGQDDALHHHRVTLFKYVRWKFCFRRWPGSGWLVPVERSGHTTQAKISYFKAPDNADEAEGIAGLTWSRRKVVSVSNLPDLVANPSDEDFDRYAKNTGVSVAWLRENLPKARSFCGIPVETRGRLWGVIVLDSRNPSGINEESQSFYRPVSRFLAKLLERV